MRISDWSSDVCSSDLAGLGLDRSGARLIERGRPSLHRLQLLALRHLLGLQREQLIGRLRGLQRAGGGLAASDKIGQRRLIVRDLSHDLRLQLRSEEHTSELQSLMRISYAVFCLKQKTQTHNK